MYIGKAIILVISFLSLSIRIAVTPSISTLSLKKALIVLDFCKMSFSYCAYFNIAIPYIRK